MARPRPRQEREGERKGRTKRETIDERGEEQIFPSRRPVNDAGNVVEREKGKSVRGRENTALEEYREGILGILVKD